MAQQDFAVVAGVDGSESSHRAVDWASGEARQRGLPLHIVYALPGEGRFAAARRQSEARDGAQRMVDAVAERARESAVEDVQASVLDGPPAKALVELSQRSALVVLGNRGQGGFAELLLGSISVHVTAHAACPVAVVPGHDEASPSQALSSFAAGSIVVGVDASDGAVPALEFAFARAQARGAAVVALHAWQLPAGYGGPGLTEVLQSDSAQAEQEASARLADALASWQERYPQVSVDQRTVQGHTVGALAEASRQGAQLIAVGSRGHGTLAGRTLGSVSQGVLRHAHSPVVVAR